MTEQKCVRTYEVNFSGQLNPDSEPNCRELNLFLKCGWKVVMVTPKPNYNEYIIEREVDTSRLE